jgi:hypothetical protein
MSETRRCDFEPGSFPESQFRYHEEYGWVHLVDPHHTTDGDLIPPDSTPGVPGYTPGIPGPPPPPGD